MNAVIRFCLENKWIVPLFIVCITAWGVMVAPFDWKLDFLPRNPVPVDAIPDIGENQQIVFTKWPGRSPRDVEDQISYPLTVSLLGLPGVKTIRSFSYFGYSSIYIIFKDDIDFYWSRSRVLEKLSSLPQGLLPDDVSPALGPDATALGQIFWYTLEGRDPEGNPTGGWNLDEIRSVQDWYVRYALQGAEGVAEVASIGGFVKEYQIDINPDALRAYDVSLAQIINAVRNSNLDVGARTIEVNRVEYVIRGVGFIRTLQDIEDIAITVRENNIPVQVKDVAHVHLGPALRRGALDKDGAEVVGGVVVVRYGENPLAIIQNVRAKIDEISPGMPEKALADGTVSKLTIVPFYDRTGLILETLGTLKAALTEEILVTGIVVVVMVFHLMSAVLIALVLPLAILIAFILMQLSQVQANIMALSGIAIAIGTMVDMGIVLCENILFHLNAAPADKSRLEIVYEATIEVAGAVRTAVLTTVVSFVPVFALQAAEGKLFAPLAYTKTFALLGALFVSFILIPPAAHFLFRDWTERRRLRQGLSLAEVVAGLLLIGTYAFPGLVLMLLGVSSLVRETFPSRYAWFSRYEALRRSGCRYCDHAVLSCPVLAPPWRRNRNAHQHGLCGSTDCPGFDLLQVFSGRIPTPARLVPPTQTPIYRHSSQRGGSRRSDVGAYGRGVYAAARRGVVSVYADDHAACVHWGSPRCGEEARYGSRLDSRGRIERGETGTSRFFTRPGSYFHV